MYIVKSLAMYMEESNQQRVLGYEARVSRSRKIDDPKVQIGNAFLCGRIFATSSYMNLKAESREQHFNRQRERQVKMIKMMDSFFLNIGFEKQELCKIQTVKRRILYAGILISAAVFVTFTGLMILGK